VFVAADVLFFAYFSFELLVRFLAFKHKADCMNDGWFVFDTFLVLLYAFDPFVMAGIMAAIDGGSFDGGSLPRLLRLARLSRLVRMLKALPELLIMIKGMFTAAASVSYTLGLLVIVTYVFAIALTQLSRKEDDNGELPFFHTFYLSGVSHSMYTLIIYGTFLDDLSVFADAVREDSTECVIVISVFIVLASMTIMNMLIGVLCEVITAVAEEERETIARENVLEQFGNIVKDEDVDNTGALSWTEFEKIVVRDDALKAFESVNVDAEGVLEFAPGWFIDQETGAPKEISLD